MSFDRDYTWQRQFIPAMKRIIGEVLIGEACVEDDLRRNTDLVVLRLEAVRIACRVRSFEWVLSFPDEFTLRATRPSRVDTELQKVVEGWGDYILYGFAEEHGQSLAAWMLGDLKVFRKWYVREALRTKLTPGRRIRNGDGSSQFDAFSLDDLPRDFVVARQRHTTMAVA